MPLTRCQSCLQRLAAKPFTVYWAWNRADSVRVAHRSTLCDDCFREHVGQLAALDNTVETLTCPGCGIETETDYDAVYATAYVPNFGPLEIEAPYCSACAAVQRTWILTASKPLEDRRGAEVSPPTRPSGADILQAMGITPRVR